EVREPAALDGRNAGALIRFLDPWTHPRRFGPVTGRRFVVVGQRAIKWVLPRREFRRDEIVPMRFLGIVEPAVVLRPVRVPRAGTVGHGIVRGRFFANPEDGGDDLFFPGKTLGR